jgi:NADH:ubiquinone oxidoreductase subunit E
MGSTTVIEALKEILGIELGETTEDNLFTLESSSCLGLCDGAPAMMINDEVFRDLTGEKVKEILEGKYYE